MPNSKQIVYLSQAQYANLIANGTITVDGVTVTYNENDIYVTPQAEPVTDVQVNGTSVVTDGVANIPTATTSVRGAVRLSNTYGVQGYGSGGSAVIGVSFASESQRKSGTETYRALNPAGQHESAFYGLAKAAGDTTQSQSSNVVGNYTDAAKSAISQMLNSPVTITGSTPTINALPGVRYVCGEVATLDITTPASGIIDVIFESGSTPTVLTVTPPTGMTMKWANSFDPTSLEANTVYEVNVMDGIYGVSASWT